MVAGHLGQRQASPVRTSTATGGMHRNLQLIRETAPACARDIIMEGDRQGADRRSWRSTVRNGDDRHVRQSYSWTIFLDALSSTVDD